MLGVEEVAAQGEGDQVGEEEGEDQVLPPQEVPGGPSQGGVEDQCDEAVPVPPTVADEAVEAHADDEDEDVAEGNGEGAADEAVGEPLAARQRPVFLHRHHGE